MTTDAEVAARFGLTLCDFCQQPQEIHAGFDHGKGKCLLADNWISLGLRYPSDEKRRDIVERVNSYNEMLVALDNTGSGI